MKSKSRYFAVGYCAVFCAALLIVLCDLLEQNVQMSKERHQKAKVPYLLPLTTSLPPAFSSELSIFIEISKHAESNMGLQHALRREDEICSKPCILALHCSGKITLLHIMGTQAV